MLRSLSKSMTCACLVLVLAAEAVAQDALPPQVSTQTPAAQHSVTLPRDFELSMTLLETVSSATATRGQVLRLAVAEDVVVDGLIVIPRGTPGAGVVARVQKGKPGKRDGYLIVKPAELTLADGTKVKLTESPTRNNGCDDIGPCWEFYLIVVPGIVLAAAVVLPLLPVMAAVKALSNHDHGASRVKPVGKDETLDICYAPWRTSYVARPVTLRAVDSTAAAPNAGLLQCPNLANPK